MISCLLKPLADVSTTIHLGPAAPHGLTAHITDVLNRFVQNLGKIPCAIAENTVIQLAALEVPFNEDLLDMTFKNLLTCLNSRSMPLMFLCYSVNMTVCLTLYVYLIYPFPIKHYYIHESIFTTSFTSVQSVQSSVIYPVFLIYNPLDDCAE